MGGPSYADMARGTVSESWEFLAGCGLKMNGQAISGTIASATITTASMTQLTVSAIIGAGTFLTLSGDILISDSLEQNANAGSANSVSRTVVRKNAIVDNTATAVLTFTCPNAAHGAVCKVTLLAQVADQESVRCAEGMVVLSRVAGANLVGGVATLELPQIATGGTETLTLAYDLDSVSGAVGASNTMDMRVTLNTNGSSAGEVIIIAEIINAEATGITVAAA